MRAAVLVDVGRIELRDIPVSARAARRAPARRGRRALRHRLPHLRRATATTTPITAARPFRSSKHPRCSATRSSASWPSAARRCADLRPGDRVVVDQGINCLSARAADLRVLRVGRLAPVRRLPRARHHGAAGRARRVHHGARGERDSRSTGDIAERARGAHRAARLHRALVRHGARAHARYGLEASRIRRGACARCS